MLFLLNQTYLLSGCVRQDLGNMPFTVNTVTLGVFQLSGCLFLLTVFCFLCYNRFATSIFLCDNIPIWFYTFLLIAVNAALDVNASQLKWSMKVNPFTTFTCSLLPNSAFACFPRTMGRKYG